MKLPTETQWAQYREDAANMTLYNIARLVEYGIQTEGTTHRIHVDVIRQVVFVYRTQDGIAAMPEPIGITCMDDWEANGYQLISPGWLKPEDRGYATARGIRIPYKFIAECRGVRIPDVLPIDTAENGTTKKGREAVKIVTEMFKVGRIPLHIEIREVNTKSDQILGKDIDLDECVIQVKYDRACFERGLFMQTHEWNPYGAF